MKPTISIVILNWNGLQDTLHSIKSCKALNFPATLIVVDNGSNAKEVTVLKKIKGITLITNASNLGFAEGNNIGIRHALSKNADAVFLLNNDTEIRKDALGILTERLFSSSSIGIVGPKIYYWDRKTLWFAGGMINYFIGDAKHLGDKKKDSSPLNKEKEVDYITGAAMLVKREVFEHIGLLDKDFFAFYEELDFNARAAKRGYQRIYVPQAVVYHKVSASAGASSPFLIKLTMRNRILFMKKNAPFWSWITFPFFYTATLLGLVIYKCLKGDFIAAKAGIIGCYQGITFSIS